MTIKNHLTPIQKKDFSKVSRKDDSVFAKNTVVQSVIISNSYKPLPFVARVPMAIGVADYRRFVISPFGGRLTSEQHNNYFRN